MEQTRAKLLPHSGVAYKIVATDSVGHYSVPSVLVSGKTLDDDTPPAIKARFAAEAGTQSTGIGKTNRSF